MTLILELVESLEVSERGVHFGIIQFDTNAKTEIPLSSKHSFKCSSRNIGNREFLNNAINAIVQTGGLTDFVPPLKEAQKVLVICLLFMSSGI